MQMYWTWIYATNSRTIYVILINSRRNLKRTAWWNLYYYIWMNLFLQTFSINVLVSIPDAIIINYPSIEQKFTLKIRLGNSFGIQSLFHGPKIV